MNLQKRHGVLSFLLIVLVVAGATSGMAYAETVRLAHPFNQVLVSKDTANDRSKTEAMVLSEPSDPKRLVAVYHDRDFIPGPEPRTELFKCRVSYSGNNGDTWSLASTDNGFLQHSQAIHASDPVLAASGSTFYAACLGLSENDHDLYGIGDNVNIFYRTSTDHGVTWQSPTLILNEDCTSTSCKFIDKPWIKASGSNLYACYTKVDNAISWFGHQNVTARLMFRQVLPTLGSEVQLTTGYTGTSHDAARIPIACNIEVNNNVNSPNGIIYVTWTKIIADPSQASSVRVEMARSFNGGSSFDSVQTVKTFKRTPTHSGDNGADYACDSELGCIKGRTFTVGSQTFVTGIRAPAFSNVAIDGSNNLHVPYQDYSTSTLTDIKYVKVTSCTTSGSSCTMSSTNPNVVNDGGLSRDQFMPWISYSQKTNALHITALDRRQDSDNEDWKMFDYHCHLNTDCTSASNWSVIDVASEASTQRDIGSFIGDYYATTSTPEQELIYVWPDSRVVNSKLKIWIFSDRAVYAGTLATTTASISPTVTDSYEGERRMAKFQNTLYTFYHDGSHVKYKTTSNNGGTWSSASTVGNGTGVLASDNTRWSIAYTTYSGTSYVYVFYWVPGDANANMYFKFFRGTVASNGQSISWSGPVILGYTAANTGCGTGGACGAVVATTDSTGTLWAAFRYKPGGQSNYYFAIKYSNDGGFNWYDSWSHSDIGSTYPPTMALTSLGSGKMLWTYAFYNSNVLNYKVYVPTQGWYSYSTTISGWPTAGEKQISADTDPTTNKAYVAFVTSGTSGNLKLARFSASDADYFEVIENADTTVTTHSLPSITITSDGIIRIYTVNKGTGSNGFITKVEKVEGSWNAPVKPFGTTLALPDQLTSGIWYDAAMWRQGSSSPYDVKYGS